MHLREISARTMVIDLHFHENVANLVWNIVVMGLPSAFDFDAILFDVPCFVRRLLIFEVIALEPHLDDVEATVIERIRGDLEMIYDVFIRVYVTNCIDKIKSRIKFFIKSKVFHVTEIYFCLFWPESVAIKAFPREFDHVGGQVVSGCEITESWQPFEEEAGSASNFQYSRDRPVREFIKHAAEKIDFQGSISFHCHVIVLGKLVKIKIRRAFIHWFQHLLTFLQGRLGIAFSHRFDGALFIVLFSDARNHAFLKIKYGYS